MGDRIDTTEMDVVVAIKGRELLVYAGGIRQTKLEYMKLEYQADDGLKWLLSHQKENERGGTE